MPLQHRTLLALDDLHEPAILANRSDPEHASMKRWAGPRFNPGQFDLAAVNKGLATLSRRFGRGRR